jgi:hypothetical protein
MSTMPPGETPPPTTGPGTASTTGPTTGSDYPWANMPDMARLPVPGNAEFAVYLLSLIVAMLVCWIADDLGTGSWLTFFQFTTIAYILSRGIAKASRVLEQ